MKKIILLFLALNSFSVFAADCMLTFPGNVMEGGKAGELSVCNFDQSSLTTGIDSTVSDLIKKAIKMKESCKETCNEMTKLSEASGDGSGAKCAETRYVAEVDGSGKTVIKSKSSTGVGM